MVPKNERRVKITRWLRQAVLCRAVLYLLLHQGLLLRLDQPAAIPFDEGICDAGAESLTVFERLSLNVSQHCRIFTRANQLTIRDLPGLGHFVRLGSRQ